MVPNKRYYLLIAAFSIQLIEQGAVSHAHSHCSSDKKEQINQSSDTESNIAHEKQHSHEHIKSQTEKMVTAVILELGILIHSLIIGITLGVTQDDDGFAALLIATCFHQMFEGIALGALVTSTTLKWGSKVLLGIAYPLTTPVGITIGIAIRNSFNSNSDQLIITQGIRIIC